MERAVCIVSGGIDSTTALWKKLSEGTKVYILSFDYGQRHKKELDVFREKMLPIVRERFPGRVKEYKTVDITNINELISMGALTGDEQVPEGHYAEENMKHTVVPNRNMILISIATGYAIKVGASRVVYGSHQGDHAIYPDCRKEFVKALDTAIYLGNLWTPVELEAPFIDTDKTGIVKTGIGLGVPYEYTWSCYKGQERPCLKCGTCIERTEAFLLAGHRDPLLTRKEWNEAVRIYEEFKREVEEK